MGYVECLLGKNEKIIIKTRRHWILLAVSALMNSVVALVVLIIAYRLYTASLPGWYISLLVLLFPGGVFLLRWLKWWTEIYMVTNRRVVQCYGIINKKVIDSSLEKVNDVVLTQSFVGRIMDFGDVEILTASEIGVNNFRTINRPVAFKTEMMHQKECLGTNEFMETSHSSQKSDTAGLISKLNDLYKNGILNEAEYQAKKNQLLERM